MVTIDEPRRAHATPIDAYLLTLSAYTDWRPVLRRDPCAYCGTPRGGTVDHIDARSIPRAHQRANLTGACPHCNGEKDTERLLLYLASRKRHPPRTRHTTHPEHR